MSDCDPTRHPMCPLDFSVIMDYETIAIIFVLAILALFFLLNVGMMVQTFLARKQPAQTDDEWEAGIRSRMDQLTGWRRKAAEDLVERLINDQEKEYKSHA